MGNKKTSLKRKSMATLFLTLSLFGAGASVSTAAYAGDDNQPKKTHTEKGGGEGGPEIHHN